ncbi:exported hypothetical protein [Candidatus Terasakiella magnetica]|nr:exported hypothetical protein [Candidatus Terasakiella magnetica]
MAFRIILSMLVYAALATPVAFAQSPELSCASESGTLLVVGSKGVNRLGLTAGQGGERILELENWQICFRCAGFPRLALTLKDTTADKAEIHVFADARGCDGVGGATAPKTSTPEKYCIAAATVRVNSRETETCRFPKQTTLATLWTALTRSQPPEDTETWWSFPRR